MQSLNPKKRTTSPTKRTLDECKRKGWIPGVVERHNTFSGKKTDLYGFIDVVVMDDQPGLLAIQATSGAHGAERRAKILSECEDNAREWLKRGNRILVWAWIRYAKPVERRWWRPREYEITMGDFDDQTKAGD